MLLFIGLLFLDNWKHHKIYKKVQNQGQRFVATTWVVKEKYKEGINVTKVRLVAQGFKEDDLDRLRKDLPTCAQAKHQAAVCYSDFQWVENTFLEHQINSFIKPPKEAETDRLWKLKKTVYGLSDVSRTWHLCVKEDFLEIEAVVSKLDEDIFFWYCGEHHQGMVCSHLDDFCWSGTSMFKKQEKTHIKLRRNILFQLPYSANSTNTIWH